jgi:hypothetical protein
VSDSTEQQPADPTGGLPPAPPVPPYAQEAAPASAPPAYAPAADAYVAPTYAPPASYAQPAAAPAPTYGQPTYGQPAYGQPAYGAYPAPRTNTLAIVALVSGIAAFVLVPLIGSIVAVITGHISLKQLRTSGEGGRGMALTGTILGWVGIGLAAIGTIFVIIWFVVLFGAIGAASTQYSYS